MKIDYYKYKMEYPYFYVMRPANEKGYRIQFEKDEARLCLKLSKIIYMSIFHKKGLGLPFNYDNIIEVFNEEVQSNR